MNRLGEFQASLRNHETPDVEAAGLFFTILLECDRQTINSAFALMLLEKPELARLLVEKMADFVSNQRVTFFRMEFLTFGCDMLELVLKGLLEKLTEFGEGQVCQALVALVAPDNFLTGKALLDAMKDAFPDDHDGIDIQELIRGLRTEIQREKAVETE